MLALEGYLLQPATDPPAYPSVDGLVPSMLAMQTPGGPLVQGAATADDDDEAEREAELSAAPRQKSALARPTRDVRWA